MPHFFLTLDECGNVAEDLEGVESENLAEARTHAVEAARDVMSHEVKQGRLCLSCKIEIKDATGAVVMVVPFKEAVALTGV